MPCHDTPQAFQEAIATLDSAVGPLERLLGWGRKHGEHAHCIGAIAFDQRKRIDRVALGLRHFAAVLQHHSLSKQVGKGFVAANESGIAHELVEEAGI